MQNEIMNIRREKEQLFNEKNDTKLTLMRELDQDKFKLKNVTSDLEKCLQTIKNMEIENQKLKDRIDERNDEIKDLTNEKYSLVIF